MNANKRGKAQVALAHLGEKATVTLREEWCSKGNQLENV